MLLHAAFVIELESIYFCLLASQLRRAVSFFITEITYTLLAVLLLIFTAQIVIVKP